MIHTPACKTAHMSHSLLGASEVATRLGISKRTVILAANDGRLECLGRVGKRGTLVFTPEAADRFARNRTEKRA